MASAAETEGPSCSPRILAIADRPAMKASDAKLQSGATVCLESYGSFLSLLVYETAKCTVTGKPEVFWVRNPSVGDDCIRTHLFMIGDGCPANLFTLWCTYG